MPAGTFALERCCRACQSALTVDVQQRKHGDASVCIYGKRVETRKPARGGLFRGVFSHVGTCGNLHLGRGRLNANHNVLILKDFHIGRVHWGTEWDTGFYFLAALLCIFRMSYAQICAHPLDFSKACFCKAACRMLCALPVLGTQAGLRSLASVND
jgi:hypothetical protein